MRSHQPNAFKVLLEVPQAEAISRSEGHPLRREPGVCPVWVGRWLQHAPLEGHTNGALGYQAREYWKLTLIGRPTDPVWIVATHQALFHEKSSYFSH